MGKFGGGSFASGATGAAINEVLADELSKIKDPAARQWASAAIGAAAAKIVGGDAQTGASTAVSGTANNSLWDMTKGFGQGIAEGFVEDVKGTLDNIVSPVEQLKQVVEVAQAIWEIRQTPNGYKELFKAIGGEFQEKWNKIDKIEDPDEKDHQLGRLAGEGIYFVVSNGVAPEKLGIKFPQLTSKLKGLKAVLDAKKTAAKLEKEIIFDYDELIVTAKKIKKVEYGDQYTKVNGKKALKPDIEYTTKEGYTYLTDGNGRISSVEAKLELGKADRNTYAQKTVGREDRLATDDGGHLIASIFKGSGELDNLVPMNSTLNRSEYKSIEYSWKKALEEGKEVKVKIEPIYQENSMRPTKFKVDYTIDGKAYSDRLTN